LIVRKALSSVAVAALAAAVTGGTFAAFQDARTAPPVLIEGGTVVVGADGTYGAPLTVTDRKPGDYWYYDVVITNDGTSKARLSYGIEGLTDHENDCVPPEVEAGDGCATAPDLDTDPGELSQQIVVEATSWKPNKKCDKGDIVSAKSDKLSRFNKDNGARLDPGESACVRFGFTFKDNKATDGKKADNLAQGDSSDFTLRYTLTQTN
jgi:predicted ribosomally synthesized peptide with SipW-like signal peptide